MQVQKTKVAAAGAAGAVGAGPATELAPAREWYTIVVYERPRSKTVVLYLGREAVVFKIPAGVEVRNLAVVMKQWLAGGKTPAYSATIHVENLAKLLRAYAPKVADALAPILSVAEVVAHADGAQPESAAEADARIAEVCSKVAGLIDDMRSDAYLAVRIDDFVEAINKALQVEAEERGEEPIQVTAEDVKKCLMYDESVKIVGVDSREVLWLWNGAVYMNMLMDKAVKMALAYKAVLADPEKLGEYDGGGALESDKGGGGAHLFDGAAVTAAAKDIKEVVVDLLVRLEGEGIYGVRAWFAEKPDVVVVPDPAGGYDVVFSRGRITIKITLDKDYNVTDIRVGYA